MSKAINFLIGQKMGEGSGVEQKKKTFQPESINKERKNSTSDIEVIKVIRKINAIIIKKQQQLHIFFITEQ